jgi:hypothetical protein
MVRCDLRSRSLVTGAILAAVFGLASAPAQADVNLYEEGGLKIDGAFIGGISAFYSPGAQFGYGTYPANVDRATKRISGHPAWTELFLHPELKAAYDTGTAGSFYADVSAQLTATGGDGDASAVSTTYGHPVALAIENGFAGWRSGSVFNGLGLDEDAIDISGGRQSFRVGDGFLISNGQFDGGKRGGWWTQSRTAFAETGLLKFATGPVRADVFYLENDTSQHGYTQAIGGNSAWSDMAKTSLIGTNIELFGNADAVEGGPARNGATTYADRKWYVGGTFFHVIDAKSTGMFAFDSGNKIDNATVTNNLSSNRDGMNVFDFHFGGNPLSFLPDASLYGNYVYETNGSGKKVDANAWYIEPGYQFSAMPWAPKLSYRYTHFSGDDNPNDDNKKAYDPFFYNSISRGYGTWILGEIIGNYVIANSNVNIHQVALVVNPLEELKLSLIGYTYKFDARSQYGNNVNSNNLGRELDLAAEWTINDHLSLATAVAVAQSGLGARQWIGTGNENETWYLGETTLLVKF